MFSRCLSALGILAVLTLPAQALELRVCADPDNMPFSNSRGEGFENRILQLVAKDIGADLTYVWGNERRATAIEVLHKGRCDLVPSTIADAHGVAVTAPYMRSSYAFVTREGEIRSFDDPRLRDFRIGVQSVGDEAVTPPVEALLHRGLNANIRPYTLHGNAADPNTAGSIVRAVAMKDIDAAVLWGPFAGYFASQQETPLTVTPVVAAARDPPMRFAIAMATREQDIGLRDAVDLALSKNRTAIGRILSDYGVPLLGDSEVPP